ncbi:hypothetical protein FOZ60_010298 [Perkinsus olseni]|uniref:Uncharacterized protein n=1 Tax=Perkinsus olseni TaxID=32597 RepID=A0A7J6NFD4_PEROL|nr:hypothetical protein FOZ60_010298 [Perkinsus olseni]
MDKLQQLYNDTFPANKDTGQKSGDGNNEGMLLTASSYVQGAIDWITGEDLARQQEEIREEYYSGLKGLWRRKRGKEPPELATLPTVEQLMEKRRARIEAEKKKGKNGRKNSVSRSGRK